MASHDLVIIGGGPAGYAAALYGASAGLDVGLVEKNKLGGTCLNVGCIPAKELLETAHVRRTIMHAAEFGLNVDEPTIDMTVAQERKQGIVDKLVGGLASMLKGRKVTVYDGVGTLGADRTVTVTGADGEATELTGTHVALASGSVPRTIPGFDFDGDKVWSSDHMLSLDHVPGRVAIIGGGAIGCEFASMLVDLGTEVTLLEAMPRILALTDEDVSKAVSRAFSKRGIDVKAGVAVTGHEPHDGGTTVHFGDDDSVDVDFVCVSVGRRPYSDELGLDGTNVVTTERGFVEVDEYCQTAEPGVYALGDLIDTGQLAHVAFAEAILAVKHMLGENPLPIDHSRVPWGIYCNPEVAFAGLSEQAAKDAGYDIIVSKHRYAANGRAMIVGDTEGLVKVVAEKKPDGTGGVILGVHMVGPWVTEQLGQGYLSVNWEATVDEAAQFIQPHPTMSEVFGETVLSLTGRSLH
ncbi:MAG: dihydrolipoyl dehydrogenase [Acidimicrobiales bacterium]